MSTNSNIKVVFDSELAMVDVLKSCKRRRRRRRRERERERERKGDCTD
jgi:hypothetical protein